MSGSSSLQTQDKKKERILFAVSVCLLMPQAIELTHL